MRYKALPDPPADLADLATVRDALPRVPRPESDCCGRIAERVAWIEDRDAAREWLVLLRALELAARTADGSYVRGDASPDEDGTLDRDRLADRFAERILGAAAVLTALPDASARGNSQPFDADDALGAFEDEVPAWERRRDDDWRARWRDHAERLLEWWVLLGEAELVSGGYLGVTGGSKGDRGEPRG